MYNSYSSLERRLLEPVRRLESALLKPAVVLLAALGVSPNAVSASQVVVGGAIVPLVADHPRAAFALFVLALLLDGLDGALARAAARPSAPSWTSSATTRGRF